MILTASEYQRRGIIARFAHEAVTEAFKAQVRELDPAQYDELLSVFRKATAAALPSTDPRFMGALAKGRPRHLEAAIAFLEADPWFFRSGYEKQVLIRHLKRAKLDTGQRQRLEDVVLRAIDGRDRQEFRHYCRLACGIWSDRLDAEVADRMESSDPGIRRRATWVGSMAVDAGKA